METAFLTPDLRKALFCFTLCRPIIDMILHSFSCKRLGFGGMHVLLLFFRLFHIILQLMLNINCDCASHIWPLKNITICYILRYDKYIILLYIIYTMMHNIYTHIFHMVSSQPMAVLSHPAEHGGKGKRLGRETVVTHCSWIRKNALLNTLILY